MDGYNGFRGYNGCGAQGGWDDDVSKVKLPKWVWIVAVVGLAFAILCGYYRAVLDVNSFKVLNVDDTNGDSSTELNTLDFSDFLGVYDNYYGYN